MSISKKQIEKTMEKLQPLLGGTKDDYFALCWLQAEFQISEKDSIPFVDFGDAGLGVNSFFIDGARRNLYLYSFIFSKNRAGFSQPLQQLVRNGMAEIFGNGNKTKSENFNELSAFMETEYSDAKPLNHGKKSTFLDFLKSRIVEDQAIIDRVYISYIYNGSAEDAEQSVVLDGLREDLEGKKYLIDRSLGRPDVFLIFRFLSNHSHSLTDVVHTRKTYQYKIPFSDAIVHRAPSGEVVHIGLVRLIDIFRMHKEMGPRIFDRNVRAGLSQERSPNRAIRRALDQIVLNEDIDPEIFLFNHNGLSIAAESIENIADEAIITEPRILNGAQTITSLSRFLVDNVDNEKLKLNYGRLESVKTLAKIITSHSSDFIVSVTIANNRQNPVEPWNLRAHESFQLEFQDLLRKDLSIYYERQQSAFEALSDEDKEELGIEETKAVEMKKLAQTFLAAQGEIDKMRRLPEVFEVDSIYNATFRTSYLKSDPRKIILSYKIHFRLNRLINEIKERGQNKYYYMNRAKDLIWALSIQSVLNDPEIESLSESFGTSLAVEADLMSLLKWNSSSRIRFLINDSIEAESRLAGMLESGNFDFLRTKAFYQKCMDVALNRFGWSKKSL